MNEQQSQPQSLDRAREKTEQVQQELEVAAAELGLAHGALERHLPPRCRKGDVVWAIQQNAELERKVQQAAEDLEEVNELLEEARRDAA
jgi:hypothetical protein